MVKANLQKTRATVKASKQPKKVVKQVKRQGTMLAAAIEATNFLKYTQEAHDRRQLEKKELQKMANATLIVKRPKKSKPIQKEKQPAPQVVPDSKIKQKIVQKNNSAAKKAISPPIPATNKPILAEKAPLVVQKVTASKNKTPAPAKKDVVVTKAPSKPNKRLATIAARSKTSLASIVVSTLKIAKKDQSSESASKTRSLSAVKSGSTAQVQKKQSDVATKKEKPLSSKQPVANSNPSTLSSESKSSIQAIKVPVIQKQATQKLPKKGLKKAAAEVKQSSPKKVVASKEVKKVGRPIKKDDNSKPTKASKVKAEKKSPPAVSPAPAVVADSPVPDAPATTKPASVAPKAASVKSKVASAQSKAASVRSKAAATPSKVVSGTPAREEPAASSAQKGRITRAESKLIESGLAAGMIDVVFCIDTTGSMDEYLQQTKNTVTKIVEKVKETSRGESVSVRFGVVAYRDHPPQETTYLTKEQDLCKDNEVLEFLETLDCSGGGDGAEAVFDGIMKASEGTSWRDSKLLPSLRYIFHITDAPPHGSQYGGYSETWDSGCPCNIDVNKVAHVINVEQIHYRLVKIGQKLEKMADEFKEKFTNYEVCAIDNATEMDIKITDMIIRELAPE